MLRHMGNDVRRVVVVALVPHPYSGLFGDGCSTWWRLRQDAFWVDRKDSFRTSRE